MRICFKVELQSDHFATDLKSLILTARTVDEPDGIRRQIERFSMPVEYVAFFWKLEVTIRHRISLDWEPANLLDRIWIDTGAQAARNELRRGRCQGLGFPNPSLREETASRP